MKARVVYWGTTSALYTGPGSFSVYLLNCNKKFQTRIETAGKPIWSTYFDRLPEATEWAYEFSDPHKALGLPKPQEGKPNMLTREGFAATVHLNHAKEGTVGIEELIAKYKIGPNDASEFAEFLRLKKKAKRDQAFMDVGVRTLQPVFTMGKGNVWREPGTPQTRTMYHWTITTANGDLLASKRQVDEQHLAEEQLKKVLEALE